MLDIYSLNFNQLSENISKDLFILRKETFKDRLNWAVKCMDGMEFDEYDNENTSYLFGIHNDTVLCSVRFIETHLPNMITHTFSPYFKNVQLKEGNYIESSRFFVDKPRARALGCNQYPLGVMLFLAVLNYARHHEYDGVYTIVSHSMLTILKRSGWKFTIVEEGVSEKDQKIYLLLMPVDEKNQDTLMQRINKDNIFSKEDMLKWPMSYNLTMTELA